MNQKHQQRDAGPLIALIIGFLVIVALSATCEGQGTFDPTHEDYPAQSTMPDHGIIWVEESLDWELDEPSGQMVWKLDCIHHASQVPAGLNLRCWVFDWKNNRWVLTTEKHFATDQASLLHTMNWLVPGHLPDQEEGGYIVSVCLSRVLPDGTLLPRVADMTWVGGE